MLKMCNAREVTQGQSTHCLTHLQLPVDDRRALVQHAQPLDGLRNFEQESLEDITRLRAGRV